MRQIFGRTEAINIICFIEVLPEESELGQQRFLIVVPEIILARNLERPLGKLILKIADANEFPVLTKVLAH